MKTQSKDSRTREEVKMEAQGALIAGMQNEIFRAETEFENEVEWNQRLPDDPESVNTITEMKKQYLRACKFFNIVPGITYEGPK